MYGGMPSMDQAIMWSSTMPMVSLLVVHYTEILNGLLDYSSANYAKPLIRYLE